MTAKKSVTTLNEHIYKIDAGEARRFQKLSGAASEVAASGIIRHLRAGARASVQPCRSAVREIIDDAVAGKRFFD